MTTADDVISLCEKKGGKFIPITGRPLHHETFISDMIVKNKDLTAYQTLVFAAAIQKKYNICDGPPDIIEEKTENYHEHVETIGDKLRLELDLSRKRNLLTILVPKVLSNNEQGSTE